jgi:hypothetical protein
MAMSGLLAFFGPGILCVMASPEQGSYPVEQSAFRDKPADSYSNYNGLDGATVYPIWGQAPFFEFGSRTVTMDKKGVRELPPAPKPGIHPRILFGPDELPDIRKRIRETRCGQEIWKNILCWTESLKGTYDDSADYAQPDRWKGGFAGLRGRVPLFRMGLPKNPSPPAGKSGYNQNPAAAELYQSLADGSATEVPPFYWNVFALEALRCLVDDDQPAAEKLARAVVTSLRLDQAKRVKARAAEEEKKKKPLPPIAQPIGGFQLAFIYDFLFNTLTTDQRREIHAELAATTWSHDNYGTFNTAESSRSNWATFSYWLYQVLAIEGEEGFNDLKVRGMYRGWRNLLTYGWFPSGATFEGEAKNQIGMDGIIMFSKRQKDYGFENLAAHPYLQAYARSFLPHSANPMLTGFHKYDLLGGSRASQGGFASMDTMGLKYIFPDDKAVDWYFRQAVGEDYSRVPDRPDGYYNAMIFFAVFASDFDPTNNDPASLGLGHTFFCGERSLLMTRSSWDRQALMVNLHTRGASGGHEFADRNALMVAGAGRIWSPNGYANFKSTENSIVVINGESQDLRSPGRVVDFVDQPGATFAVGDAKYAWDWNWRRVEKSRGFYTIDDVRNNRVDVPEGWEPVKQTSNDFAFTKQPHAYLDRPIFEYAHWIQPNGALSPYVRKPFLPVRKAFRTAGLVRGDHPYALVVDDIQKDDAVQRYDWALFLEYDIQIVGLEKKNPQEMDILLWGSDPDQLAKRPDTALPGVAEKPADLKVGSPMLLVRVLHRGTDPSRESPDPEIVEVPNLSDAKKYGRIRRLLIPSYSVSPGFKVLLYPHRYGDPLPQTKWSGKRDAVEVSFGKTTDQIQFTPGSMGKTDLTVLREGRIVAEVKKPVAPLESALP